MEELGGPRLPEGVRDGLRSYRVEERRPVVLGLWLPLVDASEEAVTAQLAPLLSQVRAPCLSLHGDDPGADYESVAAQAHPDRAGRSVARVVGHWLHRVEPERFLARLRGFHSAT